MRRLIADAAADVAKGTMDGKFRSGCHCTSFGIDKSAALIVCVMDSGGLVLPCPLVAAIFIVIVAVFRVWE